MFFLTVHRFPAKRDLRQGSTFMVREKAEIEFQNSGPSVPKKYTSHLTPA